MTATVRPIARQFAPVAKLVLPKVLITGCSFTFNNSLEHACSWPYYLRDLADVEEIYDCSQVGAGNAHMFNSIINEIETNNDVSATDTLVIVMLSGMTRTDVIATQDVTKRWHTMSNYCFDQTFATLNIPNSVEYNADPLLTNLSRLYKLNVDVSAQVLESSLKIIALDAYLKCRGFNYIISSWKNPEPELAESKLKQQVLDLLAPLEYLGDHARRINQCVPDGHPTPDGYLDWTRQHLVPFLLAHGLATDLHTI